MFLLLSMRHHRHRAQHHEQKKRALRIAQMHAFILDYKIIGRRAAVTKVQRLRNKVARGFAKRDCANN